MRSYDMLSDHDFELLIADLLGAEDGVVYEAFARGADLGVDLRHLTDRGPDVIQCKHMRGSTYPQLKAAAAKEADKLSAVVPNPASYRFVTTQPLTAARKRQLAATLCPWIAADDQVLGADDLEGLLNRNPNVERAHVKLWLASAAQLDERIHAATWARSVQLRAEITASLPLYAESNVFWEARQRLRDERVLVITGPPGIGKTTLARMLLADAAADGYEPIEVSSDIEEAFQIVNGHDPRAFYYDDFLGSTFLQDRLAKNEDKRLTSFMRRSAESSNNLLVLTTREHILQQAASWYEELERAGLPLRRFLLELSSYSRFDRARIFYNHVWHSGQLGEQARRALLADRSYLDIIDHQNYNPRLIEYITGLASRRLGPEDQDDYVGFAVGVLDQPDLIWERAFERQLDENCRDLLVVLVTLPGQATVEDLCLAFNALLAARGRPATSDQYRAALRILDDSFARSHEDADHTFVTVADPSVEDFVAAWLTRNPEQMVSVIRGTVFFEQLRWLHRRIDITGGNAAAIREAFTQAVLSSWESGSPEWQEVFYGDSDTPQTSRRTVVVEDRLRFVQSLMHADSAAENSLRTWFDQRLAETAQNWRAGIRNPSYSVALIRTLREGGYPIPFNVLEAARDGLRDANYDYGWGQLAELRRLAPEAFEPTVDRQLVADCERWLSQQLAESYDIRDIDELESMRGSAVAMGAQVDESAYNDAYAQVEARESHSTADPDDAEPDHQSGSMSPEEERDAIDALFARLNDLD